MCAGAHKKPEIRVKVAAKKQANNGGIVLVSLWVFGTPFLDPLSGPPFWTPFLDPFGLGSAGSIINCGN